MESGGGWRVVVSLQSNYTQQTIPLPFSLPLPLPCLPRLPRLPCPLRLLRLLRLPLFLIFTTELDLLAGNEEITSTPPFPTFSLLFFTLFTLSQLFSTRGEQLVELS